ncbi:AAA family ATPase [Thalassospira sp. ER-Se-21-Dark]|uniref:AAA family ATPase n=1 Tax=Thalassospira sp. ER-Se-21-Dark TaxID=2585190 RepID=UPI001B31377B|nr:AAA family ATPase [Thalassospira sp. ER-Se-21-Dark]MBP3125424.1 hypothetical protein [Thalassospira sp. ER-Se-21-Dark]
MRFVILSGRRTSIPEGGQSTVFLRSDSWNDYSFVTMFHASMYNSEGEHLDLGAVKIGFTGQSESVPTRSTLAESFDALPSNYFSVALDASYYETMMEKLGPQEREVILRSLNDVAYSDGAFQLAKREAVTRVSLFRDVNMSVVLEQYRRVLLGASRLTDFNFGYVREEEADFTGIELSFDVKVGSKPSTNIHAIIGRNGVGKTTVLNGMIEAFVEKDRKTKRFVDYQKWFGPFLEPETPAPPIDDEYFSSLISVSFSAFDPFKPPKEQTDRSLGNCYHYIGLRNSRDRSQLKNLEEIYKEFVDSFEVCLSEPTKEKRWLNAIYTLESDENFAETGLRGLVNLPEEEVLHSALRLIRKMSSGHAVVLLTLTKLVSCVEEKTLVLVDEPESHLHPPLLSAFTRSLSQLLLDRNGVAIIATHSPVVLQEIPKSCVWKVHRSKLAVAVSRPDLETFGENVGTLTREVFGLEVSKSGFHTILSAAVRAGDSYDEIIAEFGGQLGLEAQAILRALIFDRDQKLQ